MSASKVQAIKVGEFSFRREPEMANTARDKQAMMEQRLQKAETNIEKLQLINERLLARIAQDEDNDWWKPIALGTALFAIIFVLAKYF